MADDSYHIYKVPRPVRRQSFPATPPLPIRVPVQDRTIYTQNELYSAQLSPIPSSAPPALPPRNNTISTTADSDNAFFSPPSQSTTPPDTGSSSSKRRWKNSIPHFGSFKEKSRKAEYTHHQKRHLSAEGSALAHPLAQPGDILTLGRLAANHPHSFPFQVKVLQSYSFQASQLAISDSEMYNLLLVKKQQFVSMQDRLGMAYYIPLNSAVQFGYVNSSDHKRGLHSLTYKSYTKAADLLTLGEHEMPRVVCAQETHKGQSRKCSVEENEVLLILQMRKSKLSGRKYLKVYSFSTKSRKNLYPDCVGHFTTNPAHLRLWLTDMVNVYSRLFPCQAVIYLEKRFTSALKSFPTTLLQADSYVTLTELVTQTSIVASRVIPHSPQGTSQNGLLDLPMTGLMCNLQIELQTPHNTETLHSAAQRVYEGLDITSLQSLDDGISERAYATKTLFYTILRRGSEHVGVSLLAPSSVNNSTPAEWALTGGDGVKTPPDSEQDSDSDIEHYEKISDWVEPVSADSSTPHNPSLSSSQTSDTAASSLSSQNYDLPPLTSASPSQSSGFHSFSLSNRNHSALTNSLFHPISSTLHERLTPTHADEEYEMMDLPDPPPIQYRELTENDDSLGFDVRELRKAVRMLDERVVHLEKKVVEYQQLQGLVRTLSQRISKLERQLMPHSPSSNITAPFHMASARAANITFLRSLNPSQVSICPCNYDMLCTYILCMCLRYWKFWRC